MKNIVQDIKIVLNYIRMYCIKLYLYDVYTCFFFHKKHKRNYNQS